MISWYLDIIVGYLVRTLVHFIKMRQSERWPVEKGTISSAICPRASYGGPVAEAGYTYIHKGEYYSGVHTKAFILKNSGEDYVGQIPIGAEIPVRVKPTHPKRQSLWNEGAQNLRNPRAKSPGYNTY